MRKRNFQSYFFIAVFSIFYFLFFSHTYAGGIFDISPRVIDVKGVVRDGIRTSITISSLRQYDGATIYGWADNITPKEGWKPLPEGGVTYLELSLAHWLEFPRRVELGVKETKDIPLLINVHPRARPGVYHAMISFGYGDSDREAKRNPISVLLNVEIMDVGAELLQIKEFAVDKTIFLKGPATFSYVIENGGKNALVPQGKLRFFDPSGKLIDTLDINTQKVSVVGGESHTFHDGWNASRKTPGRYKVSLDMFYGSDETRVTSNTLFFWILPVPYVTGGAFVLFLVLLFGMWLITRGSHHEQE